MYRPPRILFLASDSAHGRAGAIRQALEHLALATVETWTPGGVPALDERQMLLARRLLLERRKARGWDEVRAAAALAAPQARALVALAQREFDGLVLDAGVDAEPLLHLLEGLPGASVTELWIGRSGPADSAFTFGWADWPRDSSAASIAASLTGAARWLATFTRRSTIPLLVRFAGGNDPQEQQVERFHQTLTARGAALDLPLYSPLFFEQGRLQAQRILEAVKKSLQPDGCLPVLSIPQLRREEFSRCLRREGGEWEGAYLAGAEGPVVCLDAESDERQAVRTVERLARALRRESGPVA